MLYHRKSKSTSTENLADTNHQPAKGSTHKNCMGTSTENLAVTNHQPAKGCTTKRAKALQQKIIYTYWTKLFAIGDSTRANATKKKLAEMSPE